MAINKKITLGILAHVDAGKTTLSEAILYKTGELRKLGRVDHKDTFLDDNEVERNRGITVFSKQARFDAHSIDGAGEDVTVQVTLIDTPGHVDFSAEMERSLSVIDYGLLVVSGSEGIQAHTRTLYKMLKERNIPVIIFINKLDIAVRKPEEIIADIAEELEVGAVDFMQAAKTSEYSEEFIDDITLYSPKLADIVLEGSGVIEPRDIAEVITRGEIVPCLYGSALKLTGIDELVSTIGVYTQEPDYLHDVAARIYKITNTENGEKLCFLKVTGGEIHTRDRISGRSLSGEEWEAKINQIRLYSGSKFVTTDTASAGTVCGVTGLKDASAGDVIGCEELSLLQSVHPFIVSTVRGPAGMDPYLVMKDIMQIAEEDPALNVRWYPETGEIGIRLMGQVQLEILSGMIKDRFGYDVTFGNGSILYLETIKERYEGVGHFEPLRHYAEVHLILEPGERGSGIVISSDVHEDDLALNWQRLILTHIEEREHPGVLTGAPLTDVKITLAAGKAHEKHTSGGDFREATYRAIRNALMQARADGNAVLLEPWQDYEITLPTQNVGRAMTDIKQMGGTQDNLEQDGDLSRIRGRAPASEISDYQMVITGYTSGEGRLSSSLSGYFPCHNTDEIISATGYDPERDIENPAGSVFVNHGASDIVRWDKVKDFMHLPSVLRKDGSGHNVPFVRNINLKDKSNAVSDKELEKIFEHTYGPAKERTHKSSRVRDYDKPLISPEDQARNLEIKAKHARNTDQAEEKTPLYLVDGYNVIFADEYMKSLLDLDSGAAREHLLDRVANYAGYTGFDFAVIFDAYKVPLGAGSEEDYHGVRVIYTREDEPADIRLGLMTNAINDRRVYAISSDNLVQQDAFVHNALRISSREFLQMMTDVEEVIRLQL